MTKSVVINNQYKTIFYTLILFFSAIAWFKIIDVYHQHFFDHGPLILLYNFFRIDFGVLLAWMIYAVGYIVLSNLCNQDECLQLSFLERIIFCFSVGTGLCYIVLFVLGLLHLYYFLLLIGLCILVLCASANHFNHCFNEVQCYIKYAFKQKSFLAASVLLIGIALSWLFVVRGLYPAGEHDYFTHYYQYYMEVVRNHGIQLSKFWTDYYSEKGFGLYFLTIILTDPAEIPVITCVYVSIVAMSIFSLANHMVSRSLWPLIGVLSYIGYYIIQWGGEIDFQKSHEIISSIVVMIIYAISIYECKLSVSKSVIMVTIVSLIIAAAIITVEINAYFALLFSALSIIALLNRNYEKLYFYSMLNFVVCFSVLVILSYNYLTTGLSVIHTTLFLHYANWERLNQWGIIPDLVMAKWLEFLNTQNTPLDLSVFNFIFISAHIKQFIIYIVGAIFFYFLYKVDGLMSYMKDDSKVDRYGLVISRAIFKLIFLTLCLFLFLSFIVGRTSPESFYRFSVFFVPLFILLLTAGAGLYINSAKAPGAIFHGIACAIIPVVMCFFTMLSWYSAFPAAIQINKSAFNYLIGRYSVAQGYWSHPYRYTPINKDVCMAMSHVPVGNRALNMNINAICFLPGYEIESTITAVHSAQYYVALNLPAEKFENKLKRNGVNYFLVSSTWFIADYLPFTALFSPDNIGKYLGIKWTNGKEYLLTWRGADTSPITPVFLKEYRHHIYSDGGDFQAFFNAGIPQVKDFMQLLYHSKQPWNPDLAWVRKT